MFFAFKWQTIYKKNQQDKSGKIFIKKFSKLTSCLSCSLNGGSVNKKTYHPWNSTENWTDFLKFVDDIQTKYTMTDTSSREIQKPCHSFCQNRKHWLVHDTSSYTTGGEYCTYFQNKVIAFISSSWNVFFHHFTFFISSFTKLYHEHVLDAQNNIKKHLLHECNFWSSISYKWFHKSL